MAWLHAIVALVVCLGLPGGSLLQGSGIFAWNMFSKSETYRLSLVATFEDGERELDPRILRSIANPAFAAFLPPPRVWRHDPVGLTFRTGLPSIAALGCRVARGARRIEVTLDERADLDAAPRTTHAGVACR